MVESNHISCVWLHSYAEISCEESWFYSPFLLQTELLQNWIQLILRSLLGLQDRQEIIDFVRWLAAETNYVAKQTGSATQEENGKLPNKINKIIFAIIINIYCCFMVLFSLLLTFHDFKFQKYKPHWLKLNFHLPVIVNL